MTRRTGVPTLLKLAQEMCRLIVKFTPIIQALYGTNTALMAALAAANAACATLVEELAVVRELGD
jgi:hypothetical protein